MTTDRKRRGRKFVVSWFGTLPAAIQLNGTSDFLRLATSPVTARPFTFAFWARVTSLAAVARIGGMFDPTTVHGYSLAFTTGGALRFTARDASSTNTDTTNVIAANVWAHCAARSDSANNDRTVTLQGDIANQAVSAVSRAPVVTAFSIGVSDISAKVDWFPGQVAFPALWDVELTDAEIVELSTGVSPRRVRSSALKMFGRCLWPTARNDLTATNFTVTGGAPTAELPRVEWD